MRGVAWLVVLGGCTEWSERGEAVWLFDAGALRAGLADGPLPTRAMGPSDSLVWVVGEEGDSVELALGREVDLDRLLVDADADVAEALAEELGVTVLPASGGLWELRGPDVLRRSVDADPSGVREVFPGLPDDGGGVDLGAPRRCEERAAGRWVGRDVRVEQGDWYEFTLDIGCDDARHLRGVVVSELHLGSPDEGGLPQLTVTMDARGALLGAQMSFAGTEELCKLDITGAPSEWPYDLDRLAGRVDGERFVAVLNDGNSGVDRPIVFRRE